METTVRSVLGGWQTYIGDTPIGPVLPTATDIWKWQRNLQQVRLRDAVVLTDSAGNHSLKVTAADGTITLVRITREQYRALLDAAAASPEPPKMPAKMAAGFYGYPEE